MVKSANLEEYKLQVGEVVAGVQLLLSPFLSSLNCQLVKDQENHYSFFGVDLNYNKSGCFPFVILPGERSL